MKTGIEIRIRVKICAISNQLNFVFLVQPARETQWLAQRANRRASAQAVTSKWQLRTTSPMNTDSSAGCDG